PLLRAPSPAPPPLSPPLSLPAALPIFHLVHALDVVVDDLDRRHADLLKLGQNLQPALSPVATQHIRRVRDVLKLVQHKARNQQADRKSTRLNSSHVKISYAVFCLKKKK